VALSVDIKRLLEGGPLEWERVYFKKTFHALAVLRSICAFANDIKKHSGGYIILGVEENDQHGPVFPVAGLSPGAITLIKDEIKSICRHIHPPYYPIVETAEYKNKTLLVLWAPARGNRPYQVPRGLAKPARYASYVRSSWKVRRATPAEELDLISQANQASFDDQLHQPACAGDLNPNLIQQYLATVKSGLSVHTKDTPFGDICKRLNIAQEFKDEIKPKNAGLLLFNLHPQEFFPGAFIELTEFDGLGRFREKLFTGPLDHQIETVLTYIKGMVIAKAGKEYPKASEDHESFNYPFGALKEAIINAVLHKDYRENEPIHIRIMPKGVEIVSFPGPLPPLDNQKLKNRDVSACRRRNPNLGHFFKQLNLFQGKSSGLERIDFLMNNNGNPPAVIETDKKLNFFKVFLPVHPQFAPPACLETLPENSLKEIYGIVLRLSHVCPKDIDLKTAALILLTAREKTGLQELMFKLNQSNKTRFRNACIRPLMALGWLKYALPERPRSGQQKYIVTDQGRALIEDEKTF